jgi:hypothetical protein
VSEANVVPLHPLDDAEALAWLRGHLDGRSATSVSDLARQLGWPPPRLRRRLVTWQKAGQITRRPAGRGKVIIAPAIEISPAAEPAAASPLPVPRHSGSGVGAGAGVEHAVGAAAPSAREGGRAAVALVAAAVLLATAVGLAAVGLTMNARFAASFGQTTEAAAILAAIGLAIDVLAVVLPTVATLLWHRRSRAAAIAAWTMWLVALTMTLLAAIGFAATNIGDAVAGRARIAGEHSALVERIERLRVERTAITETRAVPAIEAALQQAQPAAQSVWRATAGCRDVTLPASGRACAEVLKLREGLAAAQRRDAIDAETRTAESKLAALPPIGSADPQAASAAEIVAWVSAGRISPSVQDIGRLRTIGLTVTPAFAGLVAMLALLLVRSRRS